VLRDERALLWTYAPDDLEQSLVGIALNVQLKGRTPGLHECRQAKYVLRADGKVYGFSEASATADRHAFV
jgi:hypothetical protein